MSIQVIDISPTVGVLRSAAQALAESQPITAELVRVEVERIHKLCRPVQQELSGIAGWTGRQRGAQASVTPGQAVFGKCGEGNG